MARVSVEGGSERVMATEHDDDRSDAGGGFCAVLVGVDRT